MYCLFFKFNVSNSLPVQVSILKKVTKREYLTHQFSLLSRNLYTYECTTIMSETVLKEFEDEY